jgi:hypothetical protein
MKKSMEGSTFLRDEVLSWTIESIVKEKGGAENI